MGLMKWMMKRGDLGGIARSVAKSYRIAAHSRNLGELDRFFIVVGLRYNAPPGNAIFPGGAAASLAYIRRKIAQKDEFGLASLCFSFAANEMDVIGIENDVALALAEVLIAEGFSKEQVIGKRYSLEEFDATVQRGTTPFASKPTAQPNIPHSPITTEQSPNSTPSSAPKTQPTPAINQTSPQVAKAIPTSRSTVKVTSLPEILSPAPTINTAHAVTAQDPVAIDEDAIYAAIATELETGTTDKGLWTRLFSECDGNETRTKVAYIRQRAEKLKAVEPSRLSASEKKDLLSDEPTPLQKLAERFCRSNQDWFLPRIEGSYSLSAHLIERFKDDWNWNALSNNEEMPWSEELIARFQDRWDWETLSRNCSLPWSVGLIARFESRWEWGELSGNESLPWSIELCARSPCANVT